MKIPVNLLLSVNFEVKATNGLCMVSKVIEWLYEAVVSGDEGKIILKVVTSGKTVPLLKLENVVKNGHRSRGFI